MLFDSIFEMHKIFFEENSLLMRTMDEGARSAANRRAIQKICSETTWQSKRDIGSVVGEFWLPRELNGPSSRHTYAWFEF